MLIENYGIYAFQHRIINTVSQNIVTKNEELNKHY